MATNILSFSQTMLRMVLFQCGSHNQNHFDRVGHFAWKKGRLIVTRDLWICSSSIGSTAIYLVWGQQMENKTNWKLFLILPKLSNWHDDKNHGRPLFVPSLTDDVLLWNVDLC